MSVDAMSEYQPPDSVICREGHAVTVTPGRKPKACNFCGAAVIDACEQCGTALPRFNDEAAALAHCTECGTPFPWRTSIIDRMKRTMEIASATGDWGPGTLRIAHEFIDDLAAAKMSATRLNAVFAFVYRYDMYARPTFVEIARSLGTENVHKWLDEREAESDRET